MVPVRVKWLNFRTLVGQCEINLTANLIQSILSLLAFTKTGIAMKLSKQVKSISYLKAHASDIVLQVREQREPLVITQNGEAKLVIQDIDSYEKTQDTLALLKILALGSRQVENNKVTPAKDAIQHIRQRRKQHN